MITPRRFAIAHMTALLVATLAGCAGVGEYVWFDDLPDRYLQPEDEYVISPGDTLNVRVFAQEAISGKVKVRGDGKISLPLVKEQVAAGLTPTMLGKLLEAGLKAFVINPVVTVAVEETHPVDLSVLGEVARPGVYKLGDEADVLHMLALAGGLTPFARRDGIFVVRRVQGADRKTSSRALRIRFTYQALTRAEGRSASFRLQDGDVLVVE
jgi:polysaccharide export outer membrane protein